MLLEIEHMSASYGKALALEDVSLQHRTGRVCGGVGAQRRWQVHLAQMHLAHVGR